MRTLVLPTVPAATRRATYKTRVRRVRRGRYRADRLMVRLTTPTVTYNNGDDAVTTLHCVDAQWLTHMVDYWAGHNPRESQAYVRLRNMHQLTHGCAS